MVAFCDSRTCSERAGARVEQRVPPRIARSITVPVTISLEAELRAQRSLVDGCALAAPDSGAALIEVDIGMRGRCSH
jgi:hypothetical protein